jgi:hypothetical protein
VPVVGVAPPVADLASGAVWQKNSPPKNALAGLTHPCKIAAASMPPQNALRKSHGVGVGRRARTLSKSNRVTPKSNVGPCRSTSSNVGSRAGAPPARDRSAGSAQGAAARQPYAEYRSGHFLMGRSTGLFESCAPPATRDRAPPIAAAYRGMPAGG